MVWREGARANCGQCLLNGNGEINNENVIHSLWIIMSGIGLISLMNSTKKEKGIWKFINWRPVLNDDWTNFSGKPQFPPPNLKDSLQIRKKKWVSFQAPKGFQDLSSLQRILKVWHWNILYTIFWLEKSANFLGARVDSNLFSLFWLEKWYAASTDWIMA